jgi:GT2 family glycosyltransferase
MLEGPARLELRDNVLKEGDAYVALNDEPWLSFASPALFPRTGFVELVYSAGESTVPVRPILRFWFGPERYRDHIMPAPLNGVGTWIGRVPRGFTEVSISPTNCSGRFEFLVSEPIRAPWRSLLRRLSLSPKRVFFALAAGWVGLEDEAALNWRWALGKSPRENAKERANRWGSPSRQSTVFEETSRFVIIVDLPLASASEIDKTCKSIERQSCSNKRVYFLGQPVDPKAIECWASWKNRPGFDATSVESAEGFVMRLVAGDILADNALSSIAAHFSRHPAHQLAYGDEIRRDAGEASPVFKPGWSPTLQKFTRYLGRAAAFRADALSHVGNWASVKAEDLVDLIASRLARDEVGAVRLPLLECAAPSSSLEFRRTEAVYQGPPPSVSIVLPTRDKADLLRPCLQSLFEVTRYPNFDVVLVDNDSVEPRTHSLMLEMREVHDRLTIIKIPGKFNFSALSNAGAAACLGDYLLFLNNDTQVIAPEWIERLLFFATRPDIGAVGAKLLYPNRKVQHAGVLLGMGGVAGHFGAGLDEQAPGWMGRNLAPHEVSAVTGACLMVARAKFDAVGRFDEVNLPVDLNDVDLCLRLAARGWRTICNSEVVLIHRQSASRGGGLRLQQVYASERRYFSERWRAVIRDDPFFHPNLSLYSSTESLP